MSALSDSVVSNREANSLPCEVFEQQICSGLQPFVSVVTKLKMEGQAINLVSTRHDFGVVPPHIDTKVRVFVLVHFFSEISVL